MVVFVETIIIDNFFATFFLGNMSYRACGKQVAYIRLIIASSLGALIAFLFPLFNIHFAFLILIALSLFILLSLILFTKKKNFLFLAGVFFLLTLTLSGFLIFISYITRNTIFVHIPFGAILTLFIFFFFCLRKAIKKTNRVKITKPYSGNIQVEIFNKTLLGTAFLDTGNLLLDTKTDLPIIVVGTKMALKILGNNGLSLFLRGKEAEIDGSAHLVFASSISDSKTKLLVLQPERIRFYNENETHTIENVMLGLCITKYPKLDKFDCILHPATISAQIF